MLSSLSGTPRLIAIVGPTGSGKTDLSISLAKKYDGEIICADSRTIYKDLDIGTAKPTATEQSEIAHHGLDLISPDEKFSAADFQALAKGYIQNISARGKIPILVGGSGMYIDALLYDYSFSLTGAARDETNPRHLSSSVEVSKKPLMKGCVLIGINPGRDVLRRRITERVKTMIENGVVEETKSLVSAYGWGSPGASGNIYQSLRPYIEGESDLEGCLANSITLDMRLAKRQMTWFKRNPDIHWFDNSQQAEQYLSSLLVD